MEDHNFNAFLDSVRKEKSKDKKMSITPLNYENFKIEILGDGILNLSDIVALYDWTKDTLKVSFIHLKTIIDYHPDSPSFWLKDLHNKDERGYTLGLNLEQFTESKKSKAQSKTKKELGYYIPDNYELAKNVMKDFIAIPGNDQFKIEDVSFRDTAMWSSKSKKAITALASFIQDTIVAPDLNFVLSQNEIEKCIFTKTKVDFEYKTPIETKKTS